MKQKNKDREYFFVITIGGSFASASLEGIIQVGSDVTPRDIFNSVVGRCLTAHSIHGAYSVKFYHIEPNEKQ